MKILLVEDDDRVALTLQRAMARQGLTVLRAACGAAALALPSASFDAVLLDLHLPDMDGLEVCRRFRDQGDVPIVIVSARSDLNSRVQGLALADDYLCKPFDVRELLARIRGVIRRAGDDRLPRPVGASRTGRLHLDVSRRRVALEGVPVELTRKEFDLLVVLIEDPSVIVTREELVCRVWGPSGGHDRTLEVHIGSLRSKLGGPEAIRTVRGVGYQLGTI